MRQDAKHYEVFAKQESLGDDFALIFEAVADAFRGMTPVSQFDSRGSKIHFAGWR